MIFEISPANESMIKVIGVGGGGSNAVNYMFQKGINGVNFIVCNTDQQALDNSAVPTKITLGPNLTGGRGAGAKPEVGKKATIESEDEIRSLLMNGTQMVFVTAGMGGGTGTGGAPVVAKIAKELGILTVAIITEPFSFEGKSKKDKATQGIEDLRENIDSLIIISNDKVREIYGNLSFTEAFNQADDIVATAAKGISEIITKPGLINVDFEDVKTVMMNSGVAIMGIGKASGQNRALQSIENALNSPLLNDNDIYGARGILLYIASGAQEITLDEITQITEYVQNAAGNNTEVIWGVLNDDSLQDEVSVTLIATGFNTGITKKVEKQSTAERIVHNLGSMPSSTIPSQSVQQATVSSIVKENIPVQPVSLFEKVENNLEEMSTQDTANMSVDKDWLRKKVNVEKSNDPSYVEAMEHEPAFQRKRIQFLNTPYSSQPLTSKFSITKLHTEDVALETDITRNKFLDEKPD